jgi:hypothetical protein
MDISDIVSLVLTFGGLTGALLAQRQGLRKERRVRADAFERLYAAERRAADAAAEIERADAVAAKLWLYVAPSMLNVYNRAVQIFGKTEVDRNMRHAVEMGDWKLPSRGN